jgi:hypothetical protein
MDSRTSPLTGEPAPRGACAIELPWGLQEPLPTTGQIPRQSGDLRVVIRAPKKAGDWI